MPKKKTKKGKAKKAKPNDEVLEKTDKTEEEPSSEKLKEKQKYSENIPNVDELAESINEKEIKEEKKSNIGWIIALVFGIMIIVTLGYTYNTITYKNMLEQKCNEYANSPDLINPMECVPLDADSNRGDYVDQKSTPQCRCKIFLKDGNTTIIDIRVSK